MKEFVEKIAVRLEKKIPSINVSVTILNLIFKTNSRFFGIKKIEKISQTIDKWLSNDVYQAEKIKDRYGFIPETPIEFAIDRQIGWYKQNKDLKT